MKKLFSPALTILMIITGLFVRVVAESPGRIEESSRLAAHRAQIRILLMEFKNAKTEEQRREVHKLLRLEKEQYRAANNTVKELLPAELEARKQKVLERLRKEPFRWDIYQLRRSMANTRSPEEWDCYRGKVQELVAKHILEEEAKLTPERRVAAQVRQEKILHLYAELKPLAEQLLTVNTEEGRKAIHAQMRGIRKRHHESAY